MPQTSGGQKADSRVKQSLQLPLRRTNEGPVLAGWVRSPTAASEHSSSLNLGLAEWPLLGNRYFGFGSAALSDEGLLPGSETPTAALRR
jgi:hypothetical protein